MYVDKVRYVAGLESTRWETGLKLSAKVSRNGDRARSAAVISPKREFRGRRPETLGKLVAFDARSPLPETFRNARKPAKIGSILGWFATLAERPDCLAGAAVLIAPVSDGIP